MQGIKILGTGSYIPEMVVSNSDFEKFIETSDEWIFSRTGIRERHISNNEPTWYIGAMAAKKAIAAANVSVEDIGVIIMSTVTGDYHTPAMSCLIQREIGAVGSMAFDVNAACAGFVYAFDMGRRYLMTESSIKYALIVSAENLSKITNYEDRSTCVLFGDGAAATVVSLEENSIYSSFLGADGTGAHFLCAKAIHPAGKFSDPNSVKIDDKMPETSHQFLIQDGKEVYKFATKILPKAVITAAEKIGMDISNIDLIIPHQANVRIIETAADRLNLPLDKFYINLDKYGNTSSASIPIALDEAVRNGKIKSGDIVCFVGFGAGLTYGAVIFKY